MSEGSALTHLYYKLYINGLADQFLAKFSAEWFAGRMGHNRGAAAPYVNLFQDEPTHTNPGSPQLPAVS